jgi:hypothetical protein
MIEIGEKIEFKVVDKVYHITRKDNGRYSVMHRGWYYGSELDSVHEAISAVAEHYAYSLGRRD